jgi:hypothetical protein
MRRIWAAMLLASLPLVVLAQQGPVLRESMPPLLPPSLQQQPPVNPPADDTVTSAPLPPPDNAAPMPPPGQDNPANAREQMVPNPLEDPNAVPAPAQGKQAQQNGQAQRGGWTQMGTATLQALDKVNARGSTLVVKVGDTGHFGSLDIAVRGCFVRPPDLPADATAFLVIRDQHADKPAFSGWMVRSAPYMSMLAHPIYDVRVASCAP